MYQTYEFWYWRQQSSWMTDLLLRVQHRIAGKWTVSRYEGALTPHNLKLYWKFTITWKKLTDEELSRQWTYQNAYGIKLREYVSLKDRIILFYLCRIIGRKVKKDNGETAQHTGTA